MVTALAAVVRRLPCFALDVGDDPAETARAIDEALEASSCMNGGLVSVVVPAFDEEAFIAEALRSVLAQSYAPVEVIVVDDGSSDHTAEIAEAHGARLVRQSHRGPAAARNVGLELASGAYWTIFDADDLMLPDRLAREVAHLETHPELGMVFGLTEAFVTPR